MRDRHLDMAQQTALMTHNILVMARTTSHLPSLFKILPRVPNVAPKSQFKLKNFNLQPLCTKWKLGPPHPPPTAVHQMSCLSKSEYWRILQQQEPTHQSTALSASQQRPVWAGGGGNSSSESVSSSPTKDFLTSRYWLGLLQFRSV